MAYRENSTAYQKALNRFYGGEMSCAGQLYTPMFGLVSKTPEDAYNIAYQHSIFDIGYAKDISALVAAMTHMALRSQSMDSILDAATFIDPEGYQDSRLVRRIAYSVADVSIKNVLAIKDVVLTDSLSAIDSLIFRMPKGFPGSQKDWIRQESVYQLWKRMKRPLPSIPGRFGRFW